MGVGFIITNYICLIFFLFFIHNVLNDQAHPPPKLNFVAYCLFPSCVSLSLPSTRASYSPFVNTFPLKTDLPSKFYILI